MDQSIRIVAGFVVALLAVLAFVVATMATGILLVSIAVARRLAR